MQNLIDAELFPRFPLLQWGNTMRLLLFRVLRFSAVITALSVAAISIPAIAIAQDWTQIGSLPGLITAGFFFDTQSGFVACSLAPNLFKTTNGGITWTQIILPPDVQVPGGEITSINMTDRANGWFSLSLLASHPSTHAGIYQTSDSGNTWIAVDSPQYNCVKYRNGALYTSDGGIAVLNDTVCMISGAAPPLGGNGGGVYVLHQSYITLNAGKS